MYSANIIALGSAAIKSSETEQRIAVLLYDDNFQVISSFELNQIASLTYHESSIVSCSELDYTEKILEHILTIISKPIDYSPLSIEKALVITKHILIFGANKVIHNVRSTLGKYIEQLQQYNTALIAQQQTGATGFYLRLKGGTVDKGGTVREIAITMTGYIYNEQILNYERNTQADPNSLVPVGDRKKISYISDEARLRYIKRKMEHHKAMEQRSNLVKSNDGFGGGYNSRDGKTVVGASHGIDVMIQQAQREKQKFSDDTSYKAPAIDVEDLRQYAQEFERQHNPTPNLLEQQHQQQRQPQQYYYQQQQQQQQYPSPEVDLLAFDVGSSTTSNSSGGYHYNNQQIQQNADLLDFGYSEPIGNKASGSVFDVDLFGGGTSSGGQEDLLYTAPSPDVGQIANAADLLSMMSLSGDPYGTTTATTTTSTTNTSSSIHDPFASTTINYSQQTNNITITQQQQPTMMAMKKNVMSTTNEDRFAALDFGLSGSNNNNQSSDISPSSPTPRNSIAQSGDSMSLLAGGLGSLSGGIFSNPPLATKANNNEAMHSTFGSSSGIVTIGYKNGSTGAVDGLSYNHNISYNNTGITSSSNNISDIFSNINGVGLRDTSLPSMTLPSTNLASIQISSTYVPSDINDDDIASGFVMGGTVGAGLDPVGQPPSAPPPPPPPPGTEW